MKVVDYKIVLHRDHELLAKAVKRDLLDGWEPTGGLAYNPNSSTWYQAMVKRG